MNIKPINDKVLIKCLEEKEKILPSGIIIPKNNNEKSNQGIILAASEKTKFLKSEFKIGDKVLFNKYSGQIIKINKEDFVLVKQEDILAVIE